MVYAASPETSQSNGAFSLDAQMLRVAQHDKRGAVSREAGMMGAFHPCGLADLPRSGVVGPVGPSAISVAANRAACLYAVRRQLC